MIITAINGKLEGPLILVFSAPRTRGRAISPTFALADSTLQLGPGRDDDRRRGGSVGSGCTTGGGVTTMGVITATDTCIRPLRAMVSSTGPVG
jgi:hypothetical protein